MFIRANGLIGRKLFAVDGELGRVEDLYLDDETWNVRYLAVDTSDWLRDSLILVSTCEIAGVCPLTGNCAVSLTKDILAQSPVLPAGVPVTRKFEIELCRHFGWLPYWPLSLVGLAFAPSDGGNVPIPVMRKEHAPGLRRVRENRHLHGMRGVEGHRVHAVDGDVGEVRDFITETNDWTVRYLVVDMGLHHNQREVLMSPSWIHQADWTSGQIWVRFGADEMEASPPFEPDGKVSHEYETRLLSLIHI